MEAVQEAEHRGDPSVAVKEVAPEVVKEAVVAEF
jgi:hypothetical protein